MGIITREQQVELERLMNKDLLHPKAVIEAAESPNSPFHDNFEWDDSVAAEKYRVEQARQLIQSFKIYNEELKINVRAFTSLEMDRNNKGGYRLTTEAMKAPDLRAELIRTALKELETVRNKYAHLQELAQVWEAIDSQETTPKPVKSPKVKQPKIHTRFNTATA